MGVLFFQRKYGYNLLNIDCFRPLLGVLFFQRIHKAEYDKLPKGFRPLLGVLFFQLFNRLLRLNNIRFRPLLGVLFFQQNVSQL